MDFEIVPNILLPTVKRLYPHRAKMLRKGPLVTFVAEGEEVVIFGQFENQWSVPAVVHERGICTLKLVSLTTTIGVYPAKESLRFTLLPDGLRIGKTKIPIHDSPGDLVRP